MWKLHIKLNFPNIFRLAIIYTWAMAFKIPPLPLQIQLWLYTKQKNHFFIVADSTVDRWINNYILKCSLIVAKISQGAITPKETKKHNWCVQSHNLFAQ